MTLIETTNDTFPEDLVRYCIKLILKEARQEDRSVRQMRFASNPEDRDHKGWASRF